MSGARRIHRGKTLVSHHLGVSAFAEHPVLARESLVKVDATLPFEEAAIFGCAVMTGVGAVTNTVQTGRGASVAIVGLGGVGLAALLGARAAAAATIIACDLSDEKLALARELGATHMVNARDAQAVAQIGDLTRGGVQYAFEMAGVDQGDGIVFSIAHVSIVAESARSRAATWAVAIPHATFLDTSSGIERVDSPSTDS